MYQLHIKPIPPQHASGKVAAVYQDVTEMLHLTSVPLVFQYIAIYEEYLFYLWDRIRFNLESDSFHASCAEIKDLMSQTITFLPTPSQPVSQLVSQLHPTERFEITEVVNVLDDSNIKLMLIATGIRESLKGIPRISPLLAGTQQLTEANVDEILQVKDLAVQEEAGRELSEATKMLAPLFGNNSLMIARYPDFFASVAAEMEKLQNSPIYLRLRVALEQQTFLKIEQFVRPLDCSFIDFLHMTDGKPYPDEILFLLKDTFASKFPHLVLTTAVMKNALIAKPNAMTRI